MKSWVDLNAALQEHLKSLKNYNKINSESLDHKLRSLTCVNN